MLQRIVAVILALPLTATALAMLFIPQRWYETFPGVIETGTYNAHFIRDVGCAVLVQAGVLFVYAFARRPPVSALIAVTIFVSLHALLHITELFAMVQGAGHALLRDLPAVYLPPFLMIWFSISAARWCARQDGPPFQDRSVASVPLGPPLSVQSSTPMEKHP